MRIVVDTNVLMSGIFFGGVPGRILTAWREGRFELAVSPDIADEYARAGGRLAQRFPGVDVQVILDLIVRNAEIVPGTALPEPVCGDPDDDKFLACALAARADLIVSGDKKLLAVSGYEDVAVTTPREFSDRWL